MPQPRFDFKVKHLGWSVRGGCDQALIEIGTERVFNEADVQQLEGLLRCPVCIHNDYGEAVWWGFVQGLDQALGGMLTRLSLDGMANRVAVAYHELASAGSVGVAKQTPWADDLDSQAVFGVRERIIEQGVLDDDAALQLRDATLARDAQPHRRWLPGAHNSGWQVRLFCLGWIHSLKWRYYQCDHGLIANTPPQHGTQFLGNTYSDLWLAQSFIPAVNMDLRNVAVRMRRVGLPADDARIQIQSDDNGKPSGVALGQALVSPGDVSSDGYPWVTFAFDPAVTVVQGSPVWIVLQRAGQPSQTDYYLLGVDESMAFEGGIFRVYNHVVTSWIPRYPDADLLFRVTATQDNAMQMADVMAATGQFLRGMVFQDEPGLVSVPYQPEPLSGYALLLALLQAGTDSGRELGVTVSNDLRLVVSQLPVLGESDCFVDEEGRYYDALHTRLAVGTLPVGKWVRLLGTSAVAFMAEGRLSL